MLKPWDTCQEKLLIGSGATLETLTAAAVLSMIEGYQNVYFKHILYCKLIVWNLNDLDR